MSFSNTPEAWFIWPSLGSCYRMIWITPEKFPFFFTTTKGSPGWRSQIEPRTPGQMNPISQGHTEHSCGLASAHKLTTRWLRSGGEPPATPEAGAEPHKSHGHIPKCHCAASQSIGMVSPAVVCATFLQPDAHCFLQIRLPVFFFFFNDCIVGVLSLCMHFLKLNLIFVT